MPDICSITLNNNKLDICDLVARNSINELPNIYVNKNDIGTLNVLHAESANTANSCDSATIANTANKATLAENATHAETADNATHADKADLATKAESCDVANSTHADTAGTADNAIHADNATHAETADNATHATRADTATVAENVQILKRVELSKDITIGSNIRTQLEIPTNLTNIEVFSVTPYTETNPNWLAITIQKIAPDMIYLAVNNEHTTELTFTVKIIVVYKENI